MEDREQDSKLRVGAATRVASLSLNTDVFLGLELNSRARLSEHVALSVEGSYLSGDIEALDDTFVLDFSSWNLAAGVDFVAPGVPTVSLGPRISLTALTVGDARSGQGASPGRISRMAGFLGARGALNVPLGEAVTLDASLEAHHATLRALPTVQTSRAPVGGSTEAFLPSGGFETRSFGLGRWLLALGIGVGFRL
jgi:hypothetical protein